MVRVVAIDGVLDGHPSRAHDLQVPGRITEISLQPPLLPPFGEAHRVSCRTRG
jgi:hypothetical protein